MAILSGAMTVRRYRVVGAQPDNWRDVYRERLEEFAFREPPNETGKEEHEGWVQVHSLLDTTFEDFNRWLYNQYAVFALRVDKKSLPARLFNAHLAKKCEAWCKEQGTERCPSAVKKQLKEEMEQDWLRKTLPRVATTECCWNVVDGWLVLHSLSESASDRFRKRFFRTFGLKLVPWSPLEWLDVPAREALIVRAPTDIVREAM